MPVYELTLVMKVLPRAELSAALKRVGSLLLKNGATVQKLENHGTRDLPYRFSMEDGPYYKGSYYVYSFLSTTKFFPEIIDNCSRDVDILRHHFGDTYKDLSDGCTLDEEMKPPALRKSIQELLEISKKNKERTKPISRHTYFLKHEYYHDYM